MSHPTYFLEPWFWEVSMGLAAVLLAITWYCVPDDAEEADP